MFHQLRFKHWWLAFGGVEVQKLLRGKERESLLRSDRQAGLGAKLEMATNWPRDCRSQARFSFLIPFWGSAAAFSERRVIQDSARQAEQLKSVPRMALSLLRHMRADCVGVGRVCFIH